MKKLFFGILLFSLVTILAQAQVKTSQIIAGNIEVTGTDRAAYLMVGEDTIHITLVKTLANNHVDSVQVGNITKDKLISILYEIDRSTLKQAGNLLFTNKADTLFNDIVSFDDCGTIFWKVVRGNIIYLKWRTTNTGSAGTLKYIVIKVKL